MSSSGSQKRSISPSLKIRQLEEDVEKLLHHALVLHDENNALKKAFLGATLTVSIDQTEKKVDLKNTNDLPDLHCLHGKANSNRACGSSPLLSSWSNSITIGRSDTTDTSELNCSVSNSSSSSSPTTADSIDRQATSNPSATDEVPRFYKRDLMAILTERNEWKENAISVTEDLHDWQKAALDTQERVALLEAEIESYRQTNPYQTEIQAKALGTLPRGPKFRPHPMVEPVEVYACDIELTGFTKQDGKFVFSIQVTWTDCRRFEVYRRYGEFFTLQNNLIRFFPTEAGKVNARDRIIPSLPAADSILVALGGYNRRESMKSRCDLINNYCTALLNLPKKISQSRLVIQFFMPRPGDKQIESLERPTSNDLILEVFPQVPAGSVFPEYVAIANFEAESSDKRQLSLTAGEVVQVIKEQPSGWWYVCRLDKPSETGYAPSSFLKKRPDDPRINELAEAEEKMLGFVGSMALPLDQVDPELKYQTIDSYQTDDDRQLNFPEGAILVVVERSEDGWWFATYEGVGGWVPASYLEPWQAHPPAEKEKELSMSVSVTTLSLEPDTQWYVTTRSITASEGHDDELSLPSGVVVRVVETCTTGWWKVRYRKKEGYVPAVILTQAPPSAIDMSAAGFPEASLDLSHGPSLLESRPTLLESRPTLTPSSSSSSLVQSHMSEHSLSGILYPPPRRKEVITRRRRKISEMSLSPIVEVAEGRQLRHVKTHTGARGRSRAFSGANQVDNFW